MLYPTVLTVGVGCKKGTSEEKIERAIMTCLDDMNVSINAVEAVSSIDIKKNEEGILDFCKKYRLAFLTYSADELSSVKGDFNESDFVKETTGVGSVCERSAVFCSKGKLIMDKRVFDGVTVALALKDWSVCFED
ncbi:Cobalt-precorrin-5A hydrolase [bioreactor metagenome]|uniref:Cobalt-precorrin-5A hydrolase n=1 Tax=bioreactor metagenome TaxID=1076179 RepID=A0A645DEF4_9ZZZZ